MEPPPPPKTDTRTQIRLCTWSAENCPRGGGHRSHYPTSIQLALTIPAFLQKRLVREGFQGWNKFGCLCDLSFSGLFCFCRCSPEWARGAPHRTAAAAPGALTRTRPCQPGRGAANPGSANLRILLAAPARQLGEHLTRPHPAPPAPSPNPKSTAVLQENLHVAPPPQVQKRPFYPGRRGRGAALDLSLSNAPFTPCGGPKAHHVPGFRAETVKRRKGKRRRMAIKRIFFPVLKGHCRFKSFFPAGPPTLRSSVFWGRVFCNAAFFLSLQKKIKARGWARWLSTSRSPPALSPATWERAAKVCNISGGRRGRGRGCSELRTPRPASARPDPAPRAPASGRPPPAPAPAALPQPLTASRPAGAGIASVCAPGRAARSCGRIPGSADAPGSRRPRPSRCCPARWRRGRGPPEPDSMFFPKLQRSLEMARPETPLSIFCFQSKLYGTKKKKKKKGEGDRESKKEREQAAAGGRARAQGSARSVSGWTSVCLRGDGRRVWPQAALARASPAGPHTHIPHPPDPRPRAADWSPLVGGGGKEWRRKGELPCPNPPLSSAQGQQLRSWDWFCTYFWDSSGAELVPISSQPGKRQTGYPRWGLAGSSPPAQPRTEEILKRNSTCAGGTEGGTFYFGMEFQWVSVSLWCNCVSLELPRRANFWYGWKRSLSAP